MPRNIIKKCIHTVELTARTIWDEHLSGKMFKNFLKQNKETGFLSKVLNNQFLIFVWLIFLCFFIFLPPFNFSCLFLSFLQLLFIYISNILHIKTKITHLWIFIDFDFKKTLHTKMVIRRLKESIFQSTAKTVTYLQQQKMSCISCYTSNKSHVCPN